MASCRYHYSADHLSCQADAHYLGNLTELNTHRLQAAPSVSPLRPLHLQAPAA